MKILMYMNVQSGVGLEQARCWESAIRKALMPVTPQPSADFDKGANHPMSHTIH